MSHRRLHIVLIGFMGSGKSTIGLLLAKHLKMPFIDLDQIIEGQEKMKIFEIFAIKGEAYFRKIENELLKDLLNSDQPVVISTGGGAPCHLDGMESIQKDSISFYLKVGKKRLLTRIFNDSTRPLVATKTKSQLMEFIEVSLRERENIYKKANHILHAYDHPKKIMGRILKYLDKYNL
jgi:shikimate kinase